MGKEKVWRSGNEYLTNHRFNIAAAHCHDCSIKAQLLRPNFKSRTLKRLEGSELKDEMKLRMETEQGRVVAKERGKIIERTFGDTKENRSFRRYHGYGLRTAKIENALEVMAQNLMTMPRTTASHQKTNEKLNP